MHKEELFNVKIQAKVFGKLALEERKEYKIEFEQFIITESRMERRKMDIKDYAEMTMTSKRDVRQDDYWKVSNVEINNKAPLFKGNCTIVHSPAACGKTTLIMDLLKDLPKDVFKVVVCIDERAIEALNWIKVANKVVNLSKTSRLTLGVDGMWNEFARNYLACLNLALNHHRDVVLVIDSCNKLATVANQAKIVETGNTIPGGVDQNSIDLVGAILETSGNFIDGGSLTIWGTCLLQNSSEALNKGASAVLSGVSMSDIVLNRDHSIDRLSHSRSAHLLKMEFKGNTNILPILVVLYLNIF